MKKKIRNLFIFTLLCAAFTLIFVLFKISNENQRFEAPVEVPQDAENIIDVPKLSQNPELPSGCEAAAAVMALRYYGDEVRLVDFAENWLSHNDDFYTVDGKEYGPNPYEVFAGNPFSEYAYGCYAPVIVRAVNENSMVCAAEEIKGSSLQELCEQYTEKDKPVLIWATMNMQDSVAGRTWYLADGTEFTWIAREHCMVLVGYDEGFYFFNDPETGNALAYHKEVVEEKYEELGCQAVYIYPRE